MPGRPAGGIHRQSQFVQARLQVANRHQRADPACARGAIGEKIQLHAAGNVRQHDNRHPGLYLQCRRVHQAHHRRSCIGPFARLDKTLCDNTAERHPDRGALEFLPRAAGTCTGRRQFAARHGQVTPDLVQPALCRVALLRQLLQALEFRPAEFHAGLCPHDTGLVFGQILADQGVVELRGDLSHGEMCADLRHPHDLALDLGGKPGVIAADQGAGDLLHRCQDATLRLADHDRYGVVRCVHTGNGKQCDQHADCPAARPQG